jgi:outer membrane receptor protein involved in Fe transport
LLAPCTQTLAQSARATLEEVVVTAQKREQSAQEVPISMTVIDAAMFEKLNIDNFRELEIPGLITTEGGRTNNVSMRGISSAENFGFETSVPFFIDGMYLGRARASRVGFLDLGRMEILKGPQPTYLGKNAIGGAISLVSKRPTREFEGMLDLAYEAEASEAVATGVISGPLSDTARARLAVKYREMEGWMENSALNEDWPKEEDTTARLSLEWDISDRLRIFSKAEYYTQQNIGQPRELFNCNPGYEGSVGPGEDCTLNGRTQKFFVPEANAPEAGLFDANTPQENHINDVDYYSALLEINYDVADRVTLTSITAYYELDNELETEVGDSVVPTGFVDLSERAEQFSQEVRLQGSFGDDRPYDWMVGLYYDEETIETFNLATVPVFNIALNNHMRDQTAETVSVFGELSIPFGESWTAKLGGRYLEVDKDGDYERSVWAFPSMSPQLGPQLVNFVLQDSRNDSEFTPSVVFEWQPDDDIMVYASYREGFKAGGFDHSITAPDTELFNFLPESAESWEVGAKLIMLEGAMITNIALFTTDYEDLQVSQLLVGEPGFKTANAAKARSRGLEVDMAVQLGPYARASAVLNWLDAEYESFTGAPCRGNPAQTEFEGCLPDPVSGASSQDLSGETLAYSPDFSGLFGIDLAYPLSGNSSIGEGLSLLASANVFTTSAYHFQATPDPDQTQEAYTKFDATLGVGAASGQWALELFGRNLTNEKTLAYANGTPLRAFTNVGLLARTRQLGIRFNYAF